MKARTLILAAAAFSLAVAACTGGAGGSQAPSPSSSPDLVAAENRSPLTAATATAVATPTTARPSLAATTRPTTTAVANPSSPSPSPLVEAAGTPHVDPELEAYLPTRLSGTPLIRTSIQGSVFTGGSDMCILICGDEPYRYAKELGVDIDDITIAFAVSESLGIGMIGYRARGASLDRLIPARIAIGGYTGHAHLYDLPVTVAGRPVTYLDAGMGTSGEYLMARHDVLFIVLGEAPTKGTCRPGSCASPRPGPWTVPAYVVDAIGGIP